MFIRHGMARQLATRVAPLTPVVVLLASCGTNVPTAPTPEPLSGTYTASGGGGALPAVQALTARFKELHPATDWIVSESGSNAAIKLVVSNTIDVGFVSRGLTDVEKQQVTSIPIGFSGTAVVVNSANPVNNLTREQLRQIYAGEVTSWVDLGGTEAMIRAYIREANAATRQTFEAPMLPLPCLRMSVCLNARTTQYPDGMDPERYPATMASAMPISSGSGSARPTR